MMKRLYSLLIIASAVVSLTSCLSNTDDEVTYYDDTAITAFSLGTINRYNHTTTKDGTSDSVYVTKISGSSYTCYIDQVNARIYNPDSLPKGCDLEHVVCTFSTKNGGVVMLTEKNMWGEDSLAYYSSTDSLDLSSPKAVRVYSNRGDSYKLYTLTISAHQQTGDEFAWGTASAEGADALGARRFAQLGNDRWLFCQGTAQTIGYRLTDGTWEKTSVIADSAAYKNMVVFDGYLYTFAGGQVQRSTDGVTWNGLSTPDNLKQLIGTSGSRLYALTHDGLAYSSNGIDWTADQLDSSADSLPASDINLASLPSTVNKATNNLTLIGNRGGKTVVWTRVEENGTDDNNAWALLPDDSYNQKTLPCLEGLQVVSYDGGLLATGGDMSLFYKSLDHGLTWSTTDVYALPLGQTAGTPFALYCDSENVLHYSQAQQATVLSGRLARLGWAKQQTSYTE